jgi:catechol 2,3-dioxygenase-like lactoylglutathione lyase family enzyme
MTIAAVACGLLMLAGTAAHAQTARPAETGGKGAIIGTGAFTSFVENMDRSLAFYHDAFGMEVPPLPESGERRYNPTNLQLYAMFDIPGARERHQSAQLKGTNVRVEIMEVQDVEHRTIPLRIQDPGAATLVFIVRDADEVLAGAKRANAEIVTPGGKPVRFADGTRSVLIRDVDGRFIEIRQPAKAPDGAAAGPIVDLALSIAVDDLARTTHVYRDVLGFDVAAAPGPSDKDVRALTGLAKAKVRVSRAQAPGSKLAIEFVEYRGVDRQPLHMRIQDRGAARLQVRAENIDDLVARMKQAGMKVVSDGGVAVPIPPNFKGALVADPDNFFLTPFAPCEGCAPRLLGGPRGGAPGGAH